MLNYNKFIMSKINPLVKPTNKFDNERLAGGNGAFAAKQTNIELLKRVTLANLLWENNAYCDGESVAKEIKRLIPLCDAKDVYDLALNARLMQKLRHTPLFIATEMCKYKEHKFFVKALLPQIITRADMLTDFLAIYWKGGRCPISNQAKQGLVEAFHNFNAYKFAKYDRDAAIKLRDVMFLIHPKPRNEEETELFKMIAERTLPTPETWEVMLSTGKDKKETWTKLITEDKIGGLAFLRNLRNMREANVDKKVIKYGFETLKSSMLTPMNFLQAAKINPEFSRDIEDAMITSYSHLSKLPGRTLLILDTSGSMDITVSLKSRITRYDTACAMAILAANQCEDFDLVITAGNDSALQHSSEIIKYPSKGFNLIDQINTARKDVGCGGIFTRQCLEWCKKEFPTTEFDRIIVFSDSQDCDYFNKKAPKPFGKRNYICDISAEKKGVNYKGVWNAEISGFSENFLTFIAAYEGIENTFDE